MSDSARPPVRLRADVLAVPAYRQGATPTKPGFKLSSNENPFPPLPGVLDAIAGRTDIHRYAAAAMPDLRAAIAAEFETSIDHVHLGAGSVAILFHLVQAAAGSGDEVVFAWPSFEAYPSLGLASGAINVPVPLTDRAEHDLDAMADAITERTRVILLCTPNNPTGPTIRRDAFERFMQRVPADTLVVLDEAYREFVTDPDAVRGEEALGRYSNLVVLRTFSKAYGLAALRVGYGVGDPAILAAAASVGIPLSVTGLAETAARASLEPAARAAHAERIAVLVERRDALAAALRSLGLAIPEAQGNFVWIPRSEHVDPVALATAFAEAGTLVRPFAGAGVRISVGEAESVPVVLDIVRGFLAEHIRSDAPGADYTGSR
ncbi:histidinol-phosphate transaminase [Leucobacter rhizosphaerae]|uniref:Histidinol-phosphate transaminase n=1 Tax=Leucobacter rhizosphaerae TaxID=2932245 RepID=A0ABY4FSU3_9MICO|nr:histidinol-phosphate transaminase [Leucobacter rhizosphaerae]UOQ59337.1 histidinol-phosphate transaminase [Leucobacter rhizosphaerae]